MTKEPLPVIRHSRHLIEAINTVHKTHPDAQEYVTEGGKIQVRSGDVNLSGEHDLQWDAWAEASRGPSSPE